jgi:hypothetical protein
MQLTNASDMDSFSSMYNIMLPNCASFESLNHLGTIDKKKRKKLALSPSTQPSNLIFFERISHHCTGPGTLLFEVEKCQNRQFL